MLRDYSLILLIYSVVDAIWLALSNKAIYAKPLAHLMADKPNLYPALAFYLMYPLAIYVLIFFKSDSDLKTILIKSAILGLAAYGTYNLTNAAVFKNWPTHIIFIDIAWGMTVTVITSYIFKLIIK